jgi:hypothetical protein
MATKTDTKPIYKGTKYEKLREWSTIHAGREEPIIRSARTPAEAAGLVVETEDDFGEQYDEGVHVYEVVVKPVIRVAGDKDEYVFEVREAWEGSLDGQYGDGARPFGSYVLVPLYDPPHAVKVEVHDFPAGSGVMLGMFMQMCARALDDGLERNLQDTASSFARTVAIDPQLDKYLMDPDNPVRVRITDSRGASEVYELSAYTQVHASATRMRSESRKPASNRPVSAIG